VSGQLHTVAALFPGRKSCTHRIGCWVDPRSGLEISEKKKFSCHYQESHNGSSTLVSIPTMLSWLPYTDSRQRMNFYELATWSTTFTNTKFWVLKSDPQSKIKSLIVLKMHITADSASETPNTIWKTGMNWNNLVSIQSY